MAQLNANTIVVNPKTHLPEALYKGDSVPDWATDLVGEHLLTAEDDGEAVGVVDRSGDSGSGSSEPAPEGYSDLTVDALKAEIASRNEGREDDAKVPATGNKADLVAALEADDAAQAS